MKSPRTPAFESVRSSASLCRRCETTTWPGRILRTSDDRPPNLPTFAPEIVGTSFRYSAGCRQRARSSRCVPDFGMLTQNTRGAPGSDRRFGSLPGEKPNRSSVQACRETHAAAGAFCALPVAIGIELLPQRLGLVAHALDLLFGQAALPRPDARPAVAAERAV